MLLRLLDRPLGLFGVPLLHLFGAHEADRTLEDALRTADRLLDDVDGVVVECLTADESRAERAARLDAVKLGGDGSVLGDRAEEAYLY